MNPRPKALLSGIYMFILIIKSRISERHQEGFLKPDLLMSCSGVRRDSPWEERGALRQLTMDVPYRIGGSKGQK